MVHIAAVDAGFGPVLLDFCGGAGDPLSSTNRSVNRRVGEIERKTES